MKKIFRILAASLAAVMLMSGTAFGARALGGAYVFKEETGPGTGAAASTPAVLSADQEALRDELIKATEQANSLTTYEADFDMYMAIGINGVRLMNMNGTGDLAYDSTNKADPKVNMSFDMVMDDGTSVLGESRMNAYFGGGYYYVDSDGVKQKMPMDISQMMTQPTFSGDSVAQSVGMMRDFKLTEENGIRTISYSYDVSQLQSLTDQVLGQVLGGTDFQGLMEGIDMDFEVAGCDGSMSLGADGSLVGENVSMLMRYSISAEGETIEMELPMFINYTFTSIGQPVSMPVIDPAQYTEIPTGGAYPEV